jgi:hypothetical protein
MMANVRNDPKDHMETVLARIRDAIGEVAMVAQGRGILVVPALNMENGIKKLLQEVHLGKPNGANVIKVEGLIQEIAVRNADLSPLRNPASKGGTSP